MTVMTLRLMIFASLFICTTSFAQLNSLTDALSNPTEVRELHLQIKDNKINLDDLLQLENLQILDVIIESGLQVKLPNTLYELKNLRSISLQGTYISQVIFDNLNEFENLEYLYVNDQSDHIVFPKHSYSLKNLIVVLDNAQNIDSSIKNLYSLLSLSIGSVSITSISDSISTLRNLTSLRIHCDSLTSFPKTISTLKNVEEIDLYIKGNIRLPADFGNLENLRKFRWGQCRQFPIEIYRCKNIERVSFDRSFFDSIPVGISDLKHLKELTLSFGTFTSLPNDFNKLYSLTELTLTGSPIRGLPPDMSNLKSLKGVDLQYCENLKDAKNLIESLKTLKNLEWLIISGTGINNDDQTMIKKELGL